MIELIASTLLFAGMMAGLAVGIWLKGTTLTRHCGSARFMMNVQCLAGCSKKEKPTDITPLKSSGISNGQAHVTNGQAHD